MTYDELLAKLNHIDHSADLTIDESEQFFFNALLAVVKFMKKEQDWLTATLVDIPMTQEGFFRREERWSLLAKLKSVIEKELE